MHENYHFYSDLRKPAEAPDGTLYRGKSADRPLWKLSIKGSVTLHATLREAQNLFERYGYRICTTNEYFDDPIQEMKWNMRSRPHKKHRKD